MHMNKKDWKYVNIFLYWNINFASVQPSEEWNDGPCHTCRCEGRGPYQAICPAKQCTSIIDDDYVVEEKTIYGECCPEYVRTECKDNGKIYKVGQYHTSFSEE